MSDLPATETVKGRPLRGGMVGVYPTAIIHVAANVADEETVTIGDDVYEFDRADDSTSTDTILITAHSDDTPANATDALVAAINASGTEPVTAIDLGDNDILLKMDSVTTETIACSETMAGSNNVIDTTVSGGVISTLSKVYAIAIVPSANQVLAGTICIPLDFEPTGALVQARVTSTGAAKAWDGKVTIDTTNDMLKIDNSGSTDWAATDTLSVLVF
jgi:hypothetical protein